jgi:hypothetical protein
MASSRTLGVNVLAEAIALTAIDDTGRPAPSKWSRPNACGSSRSSHGCRHPPPAFARRLPIRPPDYHPWRSAHFLGPNLIRDCTGSQASRSEAGESPCARTPRAAHRAMEGSRAPPDRLSCSSPLSTDNRALWPPRPASPKPFALSSATSSSASRSTATIHPKHPPGRSTYLNPALGRSSG